MTLLVEIFFAVLGAAIGSFLNVLIYRLPEEQSIVFSRFPLPAVRQGHPVL